MGARRGLADDLIQIGTRLPWWLGLLAAAASGLVFHALAVLLRPAAAVVGRPADLGAVVGRGLGSSICSLLQVAVPATLLIGAAISFLKRGQARTLFSRAEQGGLSAVRRLSWSQFERLIGEAFRRRGYEVVETGGPAADGGVDLVLKKEGRPYLVQCKHWRSRQVGVTVVRELNGVVAARKAAGGFVATGGSFTREAWHFAQDCGLELIDGEKLESLIREVEQKRAEKPATSPALASESVQCPKCGSAMVKRVAKQGSRLGQEFWGCPQFPACRGTRPLA